MIKILECKHEYWAYCCCITLTPKPSPIYQHWFKYFQSLPKQIKIYLATSFEWRPCQNESHLVYTLQDSYMTKHTLKSLRMLYTSTHMPNQVGEINNTFISATLEDEHLEHHHTTRIWVSFHAIMEAINMWIELPFTLRFLTSWLFPVLSLSLSTKLFHPTTIKFIIS